MLLGHLSPCKKNQLEMIQAPKSVPETIKQLEENTGSPLHGIGK